MPERVATRLRLPYRERVAATRPTAPQAQMENSAQQHRNVSGAFAVEGDLAIGPVLLVDDIVDSRWTMTEVAGVLRAAGVEAVLPIALAQGSSE